MQKERKPVGFAMSMILCCLFSDFWNFSTKFYMWILMFIMETGLKKPFTILTELQPYPFTSLTKRVNSFQALVTLTKMASD